MNTHKPTIHPQVEAIPTLEIHPSIDPTLAAEMLRVAELFHREPKAYNGFMPYIENGCGCICAHLHGDAPRCDTNYVWAWWPQHTKVLKSIFEEACHHNLRDPAWAIARIEKFLVTAE